MRLTVYGVAVPQGSKNAFVVGGRAVIVDKKSATLKEWRVAIGDAARAWLVENGAPAPLDGPVRLVVMFFLPRPASTPKRVMYPAKKPDLDKLTRAVGDALCKIAYTEDSRIVDIHASKQYAVDSPPRAEIIVEGLQ